MLLTIVSRKRINRSPLLLALAAFALGLRCAPLPLLGADASLSLPPAPFAITSISVENTNLILTADVLADSTQVTLEMRASLDTAWQDAESSNVRAGADEIVFSIPQPTNNVCFFRLKAATTTQNSSEVSDELQYATMPSLASNLTRSGDAIFHFKGRVDGSDKILITHDGALWTHVNWQWPFGPATINTNRWNPEKRNYLTTIGASKFLPETFSLESASLEKIEGRDVIAIERATNSLIVYLDDTPSGASEYEFTLHFHPRRPAPAKAELGASAELKIDAQIDGSDCLKITSREAIWSHKNWSWPTDVSLNDIHWDLQRTNVLKNEGTNTFLPPGINLSTAKITGRKGRDLATMWADKNALWVWFADNPNGSDSYELNISFGQ
jgi:hypothetical protein